MKPKFTLDKLMENIFMLHLDDLHLINKHIWQIIESEENLYFDDVAYVRYGFVHGYSNHNWFIILVLNKDKFSTFKNNVLKPHLKFDVLDGHIEQLFKYDIDGLLNNIYDKRNIRDEYLNKIEEFLSNESFYWFDNFRRSGYRYKSKCQGWYRKEMIKELKNKTKCLM